MIASLDELGNFIFRVVDKLLDIFCCIELRIAEKTAQEIDAEHKERMSSFAFSKCNIGIGEQIVYCDNPEIVFAVVDDKAVEYQGHRYSLSALAQLLSGIQYNVAWLSYFKYKGDWLNDIRQSVEADTK